MGEKVYMIRDIINMQIKGGGRISDTCTAVVYNRCNFLTAKSITIIII